MRVIAIVTGLVLLQDATVDLYQALEKHRDAATDSEQKERLDRLCRDMRDGARRALEFEVSAPDTFTLQTYDVRTLVIVPADQPCPEFGEVAPAGPIEGALNGEMIVDLIKEGASPGIWEGDHTIELSPAGEVVINTFPRVHRQVGRLVRALEAGVARTVTMTIAVEADGKRLDSVELRAQLCQLVSARSGVERSYVAEVKDGKPVVRTMRDGLAVEVRPLASGDRIELHGRVRFREWLGLDEHESPRVAEVDLHMDRGVTVGEAVVVGRALAPNGKTVVITAQVR